VDPAIHVNPFDRHAAPGAVPKRKKAAEFRNDSSTLIHSCMVHGTLQAQLKVLSGSEAVDVAALRQLSVIESDLIETRRSLRLPLAVFDKAQFAGSAAWLEVLCRRNLTHCLEVPGSPDLPLDGPFWELLKASGIPLNLIWPSGSPELLRRLLALAQPRVVFCPVELRAPEYEILASSASISVFSPCKDLLEERENPSAGRLLTAGGAVALGSGYDAIDAPIFSMQMVVSLAVLRLRLSVEQAISATTINAAHALGSSAEVGSLEAGKRANVLVLNHADYREIPRRIGVNQVAIAFRDGNYAVHRKPAGAGAS
jgi:imidazolonepropionase